MLDYSFFLNSLFCSFEVLVFFVIPIFRSIFEFTCITKIIICTTFSALYILSGQNSFRSRSFQKSFPIFFPIYTAPCAEMKVVDQLVRGKLLMRLYFHSCHHVLSLNHTCGAHFFFLSLFRFLKKIKRDGLGKFRFLKQNWLESSVYIG